MTVAGKATLDFGVERIDVVQLDIARRPDGLLAGYDLMSPYVWEDDGRMSLLVRVLANPLGPDDPTGVIYSGYSSHGLFLTVDPQPALEPGADGAADAGGVEDPTVVIGERPHLMLFYTGVDARREQGSLLVCSGPDLARLHKDKVLLTAPEGAGNIKEATVARGADGRWRLFFEYALDGASRVGLAIADAPTGPWRAVEDPFGIREQLWDNWHSRPGRFSSARASRRSCSTTAPPTTHAGASAGSRSTRTTRAWSTAASSRYWCRRRRRNGPAPTSPSPHRASIAIPTSTCTIRSRTGFCAARSSAACARPERVGEPAVTCPVSGRC